MLRHYVAVWNGPLAAGTQSQFGDDLANVNTFVNPLSLGSVSMETYRDLPFSAGAPWIDQIPAEAAAENPSAMGYAWAVGLGGELVASGEQGLARSAYEATNPKEAFTIDSRIFLWSLTKLVATAALLYVLWSSDPNLKKLDKPFLPDVVPLAPAGFAPQPEAATLTIRQLLSYTSGLNKNAAPPAGTPTDPNDPAFDYAAWGRLSARAAVRLCTGDAVGIRE